MATAPPPSSPGMPGSDNVAQKVKPPAIGLMVAAALGIAFALIMLLMNILGIGLGTLDPNGVGDQQFGLMLQGGMGIVSLLVGLAIGAFVIFGAMKMMRLERWGVALAAAIVAMVPCVSPCCLLGLPFGIWAIVVLVQPDVKAAFR